MRKVIRPGRIMNYYGGRYHPDIFCKITLDNGRLSISGVIGPKSNGNARGGCGQIDMEFMHRNAADNDTRYSDPIKPGSIEFAKGWNRETWLDFLGIWDRWHLNDMRPGCEHQRAEWDTSKKITLHKYSWTRDYGKMRRQAEGGEMDAETYEEFKVYAQIVKDATLGLNSPKWPDNPTIKDALVRGLIEEKETEKKAAGWVNYLEHPNGLLSKPCEKCGYKYGSSWLKEDVPENVLSFLENLPDTDKTPAWV